MSFGSQRQSEFREEEWRLKKQCGVVWENDESLVNNIKVYKESSLGLE